MKTRLGVNPLTWSNDDLRALGSNISLDTCLRQAAEVGYDGVELGHKFPRRADKLRPLLDEHGLALVSGWYSLQLLARDAQAEFAAMQAHFELLDGLGSHVMVCAEVTDCIHSNPLTRLSARPQLDPARFRQFVSRLTELAELMRGKGMRLAYHHHMGTIIQTEDEVCRLLDACGPAVELLLDTGHLTFAGGDAVRIAERYAPRIAHIHCKDIRMAVLDRVLNADCSFLEAVLQGVFTVPGDGCIDYDAVFAPLRKHGFEGWAVIEAEQDPTIADPLTYATLGHAELKRLSAGT